MFSVTSSSVPPPAPPNLKVLQESWPSSLPQSSTISPVNKEETPWHFDSASILQPKALLPTPTARYCQPPPTFRAGSATARPPAPLFPVPPPGSCLLPPPPLATDTGAVGSGVVSPHNWQDSASGIPSNKPVNDRLRKQSWAAENGNVMVLSSPTRSAYYNYQKPLHSRPRTLVEVPLQTKLQQDTNKQEPTYQAPSQSNNIISILQSNLDPNCRPFTPANLVSPIPFSGVSGKSDDAKDLSRKASVSTPSCQKLDMEELTLVSVEREEFVIGEDSSYFETISDKSLCFSNNSGRGNESSMSYSKSLEASKLSEDPLPEDPKAFLPQLDTSHDGCMEEKAVSPIPPTAKQKFSLMSSDSSMPPSVFPFAHWSGKARPPLLPTPKNFPPYGPRQPKQAPLFEDETTSPGFISPSPKLRSIHGQGNTLNLLSCNTSRINEPTMINASLGATVKKPDVMGRITRQQTAAMDISSSTWKPTNSEKNNLKLATDNKDVPLASPGFRSQTDGADWTPEFGGLMPCSLIESYPVPDEYMVAKVIGSKLPSIKLHNCHTDLLFFLFYSFQEDELQLLAASLLFERGWRYHKQDQVWLARWPGVMPEKKTVEWEEGLYQYFDVKVWRRIPGWFRLNYEYLAEKTGVTEKDLSLKQIYTKTWLKA